MLGFVSSIVTISGRMIVIMMIWARSFVVLGRFFMILTISGRIFLNLAILLFRWFGVDVGGDFTDFDDLGVIFVAIS